MVDHGGPYIMRGVEELRLRRGKVRGVGAASSLKPMGMLASITFQGRFCNFTCNAILYSILNCWDRQIESLRRFKSSYQWIQSGNRSRHCYHKRFSHCQRITYLEASHITLDVQQSFDMHGKDFAMVFARKYLKRTTSRNMNSSRWLGLV